MDDIKQLLHNTFEREEKWTVAPDCGVITATDENFFPLAQLLIYSIVLSHEVQIVVYDLGLSHKSLNWFKSIPNLKVYNPPRQPMPRNVNGWQTYNKPFYIDSAPFKKVLWIDVDCVVLENINIIFHMLDNHEHPIIFQCRQLANGSCNNPWFHFHMGTNLTPHQTGPPNLQAGVLAFNLSRDTDYSILKKWCDATLKVVKCHDLKRTHNFWDQGVLQWVLEHNNSLEIIIDDRTWNFPAHLAPSNQESLRRIFHNNEGKILHFAGSKKNAFFRWDEWPNFKENDHDDHEYNIIEKLDIFLLHHKKNIPPRTNRLLKYVDLGKLNLPEKYDSPKLCESRFFLSPQAYEIESEYVGLLSGSWDRKYRSVCSLGEVYSAVLPHLHENVVFVADPAPENWLQESNRDHPGISDIILDVASQFSMDVLNKNSFYANTFICHRKVFKQFLPTWRDMFYWTFDKYGIDPPFDVGKYNPNRKIAYLCERLTVLYFSNRRDLRICLIGTIPQKPIKMI